MSLSPVINFYSEEISFVLPDKKKVRQWIINSAKQEGYEIEALNYIFCDDNYLSKINVEYLKHKTLTDIITFQYAEDERVIGDVYISIERVKDNSQIHKNIFKNELHRVMIHGVLHLCGYSDKLPTQKVQMTEKEDFYLSLRSF